MTAMNAYARVAPLLARSAALFLLVLAVSCGPAGELFQLGRAMGGELGVGPTQLNLKNRTQLTLTFEDVPAEAMDAAGAEGLARRAAEYVRDNWDGAGALEDIVVEVARSESTGMGYTSSTTSVFRFSMDELRSEAPAPVENEEAPGAAGGDTGG
jgi:hypothetical protein